MFKKRIKLCPKYIKEERETKGEKHTQEKKKA
jgi:hypothetical protein